MTGLLTGRRMLIVEDEMLVLRNIEMVFEDLGCDMIYLEGAKTRKELEQFCRAVEAPKMFVAAEGREEMPPSHHELAGLGFTLVVWALTLLNTSIYAMQHALARLASDQMADTYVSFEEFNRVVGLESYLNTSKAAE